MTRKIAAFGLAIVCFALTIASPMVSQVLGLEGPAPNKVFDDPVWGICAGVAIYFLLSALALSSPQKVRDRLVQTPTSRVLMAWAMLVPVLGVALCLLLAAQTGLLTKAIPSSATLNPYMVGTMIALAVIVPTQGQGLMLPRGDERFQSNQHHAAILAYRMLVGLMIVIGLADYGDWQPLPTWLSGLVALLLSASVYNLALWWWERAEG